MKICTKKVNKRSNQTVVTGGTAPVRALLDKVLWQKIFKMSQLTSILINQNTHNRVNIRNKTNSLGNAPVKKLSFNNNTVSCFNLHNSLGMLPRNSLLENDLWSKVKHCQMGEYKRG